jgi:DNA-binding protein HU-beta
MLDLDPVNIFHCIATSPTLPRRRVTKTELVELVASRADLDKRRATDAVDAVVDSVMQSVNAGDKVSIFGFGSFNPTSRAARTGRNPRTGTPVNIAASKGVRFAPGAAFKSLLNNKGVAASKAARQESSGREGRHGGEQAVMEDSK